MHRIKNGEDTKIDNKKLFSKFLSVNYKMLILRIGGCFLAVMLAVILTLLISGEGDNDEIEITDTASETEKENIFMEESTYKENESIEHASVATDSEYDGENEESSYEIRDISKKEHGSVYIVNNTGDPVVYSPSDKHESYYTKDELRPLVLVLHTKDRQKYMCGNEIVTIGEHFTKSLVNSGIPAIFCSARHECENDGDSYSNAKESIEFYLDMYPSIKYIIDISMIDTENEVYITKGKYGIYPASQMKIEVCGENKSSMDRNLHLGIKLREKLNRGDMSMCGEVIISKTVLNSDLTPYYLTVRIGTKYNTSNESRIAADALAHALAEEIK